MKINLFTFKVIILAFLSCIVLLFAFFFYKLFVLFGPSLLFLIIGAVLLLTNIGYCLHQASQRLSVKHYPRIAYFFTDELKKWAQRRYLVMNVFLSCGMASAVALLFLGGSLIWMRLRSGPIGIVDIAISAFGVVLLGVGILFALLFYREFQFSLKNKQEIIDGIFQQVKDPREVIPQFPDQ